MSNLRILTLGFISLSLAACGHNPYFRAEGPFSMALYNAIGKRIVSCPSEAEASALSIDTSQLYVYDPETGRSHRWQSVDASAQCYYAS